MANWAESICLRCGNKMITEPRLVCTEPSWLDDYPGRVRRHIDEIEKESPLPFKYYVAACEECGIEVLIGVENPYAQTRDGRIAVMIGGKYFILSDEVVDNEAISDE